jgi:arginyl-tRNA synthetase
VTPDAIIRDALIRAARTLGAPEPIDPVVERPRDPAFGDWTTNLAMTLARTLRRKPQEIAVELIAGMDVHRAGVREATVAGAGFINFKLETATAAALLR